MFKLSNKHEGMVIIDVVIAMALFMISVSVILNLMFVNEALRLKTTDFHKVIAYAIEGHDAARDIRYDRFEDLVNGAHGLAIVSNEWRFSGSQDTWGDYTRVVTVEDGRRDGSGNLISSGGTVDPNTKKIDVTITWPQAFGPSGSYGLVSYHIKWSKDDFNF